LVFLSRRRPRFWLDALLTGWLDEIGNRTPSAIVSLG
jgi:hypothetical protein